MTRHGSLLLLFLCWGASAALRTLSADDQAPPAPLHERIDALLEASRIGPAADITDDAQFLRRISLDLTGRIASADEVRAFLEDAAPDKRRRKVDELLAGPDYPRHMAVTFDLLLMERRGDAHVKSEEFRAFLHEAIAENKPYHELVGEILRGDGTEERNRAASAFYLEREAEPNLLTRELGRIFFGMDLQCAQCHDHPLIDDYHQSDYYGLHAFVVRTSLFRPDSKKPALLAEKAEGEAAFKSVFTDREGTTGPRLPGGSELVEPAAKPGESYQVEPARNVRPIPTYSRLEQLADLIAAGDNEPFARNIANRLWAHMFGRGLVQPVDFHHSENPPAHPELLELIAAEIAATNYDVKAFLRELALSQAYQRSFQLPADLGSAVDTAREEIAKLDAEADVLQKQAWEAESRVSEMTAGLDAAVAESRPLKEALDTAATALTEATKQRDEAKKKLAEANQAAEEKEAQNRAVAAAAAASQGASEAIEDDKELAAAAATIQKKGEALSAELARVKEAAASRGKEAEEAERKVSEANQSIEKARGRLAAAGEQIRELRARLISLREEAQKHRSRSVFARGLVESLQVLVASAEQRARIARLRETIPTMETELAEATQQHEQATKAAAKTRAAFDKAQQQLTRLQQSLQNSQEELAQTRTTFSLLKESLEKGAQARERLDDPGELPQALATLQETMEAVRSRIQQQEKRAADRETEVAAGMESVESTRREHASAEENRQSADRRRTTIQRTLRDSREELEQVQKDHALTRKDLLEHATKRLQVAAVTPLTPEQLGWSVLQATGQADRVRAGETAKLDQEKPLSDEDQNNPEKIADRERRIDEATYASLSRTVALFVRLFAAAKGQPQDEFFATADQAMFFANGDEVRGWLNPAGGNLTDRLMKLEDAGELAEELYLSVLSRRPDEEETKDVAEYLQSRKEKKDAVQELAWALLTSAEFRFQH